MGLSHPAFLCITSNSMRNPGYRIIPLVGLIVVLGGLSACRKSSEAGAEEHQLEKVVLQTDWFAQPEHGGFYQALAKGYYKEEGLHVEILPGGPNSMSTQKVLKGTVDFAMNRADTIYKMATMGISVQMVMATLQHDPQGILLHASSPVRDFPDLDGRRVMAIPGLAWIHWVEAKYGITMEIVPHDYGMERFLNDETFIQQCLITNEPFYVRQAGANPRVLRLRDSGFDPYHGLYCLKEHAENNPDVVRKFIRASIRGWHDFILNDPSPAFDLIGQKNPKMNPEFMEFCYKSMQEQQLVTGPDLSGSHIGQLEVERMRLLESELINLGLVESPLPEGARWYSTEFLPTPADAPEHGRP
jgi:NitT/TauT family transport system substrate-binding protein